MARQQALSRTVTINARQCGQSSINIERVTSTYCSLIAAVSSAQSLTFIASLRLSRSVAIRWEVGIGQATTLEALWVCILRGLAGKSVLEGLHQLRFETCILKEAMRHANSMLTIHLQRT